jgi:hypothetical protein
MNADDPNPGRVSSVSLLPRVESGGRRAARSPDRGRWRSGRSGASLRAHTIRALADIASRSDPPGTGDRLWSSLRAITVSIEH